MTTAELLAEARTYAGYRSAHVAWTTGTLVVVLDGIAAGMDVDGGRWQTVCDPHGGIISHDTLALARSWASAPEQWCPYCMEEETHG